jgi:hypothetical protein
VPPTLSANAHVAPLDTRRPDFLPFVTSQDQVSFAAPRITSWYRRTGSGSRLSGVKLTLEEGIGPEHVLGLQWPGKLTSAARLSPSPVAAAEGRIAPAAGRAAPVVEDRLLALPNLESTLSFAAHDDHKIGILAGLDAEALV